VIVLCGRRPVAHEPAVASMRAAPDILMRCLKGPRASPAASLRRMAGSLAAGLTVAAEAADLRQIAAGQAPIAPGTPAPGGVQPSAADHAVTAPLAEAGFNEAQDRTVRTSDSADSACAPTLPQASNHPSVLRVNLLYFA
jgi:hypothetical protein